MRSALSLFPAIVLSLSLVACGDKDDDSGTSATDGDGGDTGVASGECTDQDGDFIMDIHEEDGDPDEDGTPNLLDDDSDGDTIKDFIEGGDDDCLTLPIDTDGDGTPDYLDSDSDNNCIPDIDEKNASGSGPGDTDGDGEPDYRDFDNDGDGLSDIVEMGGDCAGVDSDFDGTPDYMDEDSDNDGIFDKYEGGTTEWDDEPVDSDGDGTPDYLDLDSDDDGTSDAEESGIDDPLSGEEPRDTDGDGDYDSADTDSDGDGLSDRDERNLYLTDPYDNDTDGDGFSDGGEIAAGTDPLDDGSVIDGIYVEVGERTEVEEEFEFDIRIQMGDVAFMVDTTCSMSSTANAMAGEFSDIVTTLALVIPDAEYGYATYDDYAYGSFGSAGIDKPFELRTQITSSTSQVQSAMSATSIHSGADGPESSMEALMQGLTGSGYDQNCNTTYDANTDVRPFLASGSDPFGGAGGQNWSATPPGGGELGGFGFRDFALPILVYATDNYLRDPENGYGSPGGCPTDAGFSDVVAAAADLGGYVIGICTSTLCEPQMEEVAAATNSYADTDGDGRVDDLLVFTWTGSDSEFRETVVQAIEDLINSIQFETVALEVVGDEWGFITSIVPEVYTDVDELSGGTTTLTFTLNFRGVIAATTEDQLYALTLNVIGDDTILLDTLDIIVLVPGTSF
ncbi:MAG: hypothetical protein H6742_06975 [Alphaproteobacteria bacterium]|nr:hypothetical protein [Alphaproteobacteria bacterium]